MLAIERLTRTKREILENQNFSLLSNVPFLRLISSFYGHDFWHIIIFGWIWPHIKLVLRYIKFVTKIPLLEFPYFFEKAHKGMARNEMHPIKQVFPVLLRLHWIHPSEDCRLASGRLLFSFSFFFFFFLLAFCKKGDDLVSRHTSCSIDRSA